MSDIKEKGDYAGFPAVRVLATRQIANRMLPQSCGEATRKRLHRPNSFSCSATHASLQGLATMGDCLYLLVLVAPAPVSRISWTKLRNNCSCFEDGNDPLSPLPPVRLCSCARYRLENGDVQRLRFESWGETRRKGPRNRHPNV